MRKKGSTEGAGVGDDETFVGSSTTADIGRIHEPTGSSGAISGGRSSLSSGGEIGTDTGADSGDITSTLAKAEEGTEGFSGSDGDGEDS